MFDGVVQDQLKTNIGHAKSWHEFAHFLMAANDAMSPPE